MKKTLILISMAIMLPLHSDAQILDKLGKVLNSVSKVADGKSGSGYGKQLGKTLLIGDMKMSAYGNYIGIGFNYGSCERWPDGSLRLTFQMPNQSDRDVENVWIRNYGNDTNDCKVQAFGKNGEQYTVAYLALAGKGSSEGISVNIPARSYANGMIVITGVPRSLTHLSRVVIGSSGQYPMDASSVRYTFILDNVRIVNPPLIKSAGVGSILLGTDIKRLPQAVDGLYSKVVIGEEEDGPDGTSTPVTFYSGETEVMNAVADEEGKIILLEVVNNVPCVAVNNNLYRVGDRIADLRRQKGVVCNTETGWAAVYGDVNFNEDTDGRITSIVVGSR